MRNVTMLGGEGAIGKSMLLMQLSGAVVLGKDWIGTLPEPGPVLYMSCEEDDRECLPPHGGRRTALSARLAQEMIDHGLRVLSFAGKDAILAQPDRNGIMRPTPLFERLRRDALQLRPKLIVLDTVADVFAGKEIDRAQTRQFITLLRGLAIDTGAAVVMSAHPSLTGISTDTGLSGNTGWHNQRPRPDVLQAGAGRRHRAARARSEEEQLRAGQRERSCCAGGTASMWSSPARGRSNGWPPRPRSITCSSSCCAGSPSRAATSATRSARPMRRACSPSEPEAKAAKVTRSATSPTPWRACSPPARSRWCRRAAPLASNKPDRRDRTP